MKHLPLTEPLLLMMALLALPGCSTPQPALKQANHTAKLMGLLDQQAAEFRNVVGNAQDALTESMASRRESFARFQAATALDDRARTSAGDKRTAAIREQLLSDADFVASTKATAAAAPLDFKKQVEALLLPLPSTAAPLTEAQAKAVAMGTELSATTRQQELLDFLKAVKESIDENRDKIRKAQQDAAKTKEGNDATATVDAPKPVK